MLGKKIFRVVRHWNRLRSCGCPIPGNTHGQAVWGPGQPHPVGGSQLGAGAPKSSRCPPTQVISWFYMNNSFTMVLVWLYGTVPLVPIFTAEEFSSPLKLTLCCFIFPLSYGLKMHSLLLCKRYAPNVKTKMHYSEHNTIPTRQAAAGEIVPVVFLC